MPTSMKLPGTTINLLTWTSKLGVWSYSLPAGESCPGKVTGEGMTCSGCYADPDFTFQIDRKRQKRGNTRGGTYAIPSVVAAQNARMAWTVESLKTADGKAAWVSLMTAAIRQKTRVKPRFRLHDSGDMFNPVYAACWTRVMRALPDVAFWVPTRSWHRTPLILAVLQGMAALPNVAVHPSALEIGAEAPAVDGLDAGSGVLAEGYNCPAHEQDNQCGDCTACYGKDSTVYFRLH